MNLSNGDKHITSEQKLIIYSCSNELMGAMIGGTQNALQHALYLSPLLRFTV